MLRASARFQAPPPGAEPAWLLAQVDYLARGSQWPNFQGIARAEIIVVRVFTIFVPILEII